MARGIGRNKQEQTFENINDTVSKLSDQELFADVPYDSTAAERGGYSNYSYWRSTFRIFLKNKVALVLLILVGVLVIFSIIQQYLPGQKNPTDIFQDPATGIHYRNRPPYLTNPEAYKNADGSLVETVFLLGSNNIGQDLWSRIWSGTRTSLFIGVVGALVDAVLGILIGALWGYVRKLDRIITEIYNVLNNIPTTIVMILAAYIMKPGLWTIIIAMNITGWVGMARFIRNQIIIIRDREYNLASRCLGTGSSRIITKNLLPYMVSVIMMRMALAIPGGIGYEVFLTYIGLGLPTKIPSLGNLVNEGRKLVLLSTNYQLIFPLAVLSVITVSFYVMGNAFADAADPKNHVK